jgi:hypothetical protein
MRLQIRHRDACRHVLNALSHCHQYVPGALLIHHLRARPVTRADAAAPALAPAAGPSLLESLLLVSSSSSSLLLLSSASSPFGDP